jgi:hypothetical protein
MVIIETSIFTKQVRVLLSDEEYRGLQSVLINNPLKGTLIRGSGGIRKVRWALPGRGKSGGVRVIYYWAVSKDQILMLSIYAKNERDNLTQEQLRILWQIVKEEFP